MCEKETQLQKSNKATTFAWFVNGVRKNIKIGVHYALPTYFFLYIGEIIKKIRKEDFINKNKICVCVKS